MPISVSCPGCGKALKVKDEMVGKRVKCPGCGQAFPVQPGGVGPTAFDPRAAAAAKQQREKAVGKVSIAWGPIMLVAGVLLIGLGIGLFITGPKRVWNEWEKIGDTASDDSKDVISFALQAEMSRLGLYNPRKAHGQPEAKEIMFFRPTMVMSMPDSVDFRGASNQGLFTGKYHPKTGEVEADVTYGSTVGILSHEVKGGKTIKVTGRRKGAVITAEVNEAKAVLIIPPKDD